jgi:hypothetical protein
MPVKIQTSKIFIPTFKKIENTIPLITKEITEKPAFTKINEADEVLQKQFAFVTGSAGSGKTCLINKKNKEDSSYIELGAVTGIAAINLDTKTINSILKYFDTKSLEEKLIDGHLQYRLREIREEKRFLGIEECSMLSAKQLDILYDAVCEINEDNNPKKLGLHLIGDLLQLPVVSTKQKPEEMIIKANCWHEFDKNTIKLTKIWRQDNPEFVRAINFVRAGDGFSAIPLLKECGVRFIPQLIDKFIGTTIISKNDQVDIYNSKRLTEINSPIITSIPKRRGKQLSEWQSQIPNLARFKVGAYVMILSNDCPDFTFVNGDSGIIVAYNNIKDYFTIKLKRNNQEVDIPRIMRKNLVSSQPDMNIFKPNFTPYVDSFTKKWVIGDCLYHPLRLAWATTLHKSQGLSLDLVQLDSRDPFFGFPAMAYVGISRAKTPEGLVIVGTENDLIRKIKTNKEIMKYV